MGRGDLFVVSAPSGAGKTTLCRRLLGEMSGIFFSVSHTTRPPRAGEHDGEDYFFVSEPRFRDMIASQAFLEWARVHDHYYGTSRQSVTERLGRGEDVLLDIDVQGGRQVREQLPDSVLIFILPPSWYELERRLKGRGSEDARRLKLRLDNAREELRVAAEYDFAVINDNIDQALYELKSIITARRCRVQRTLARPGLSEALRLT